MILCVSFYENKKLSILSDPWNCSLGKKQEDIINFSLLKIETKENNYLNFPYIFLCT